MLSSENMLCIPVGKPSFICLLIWVGLFFQGIYVGRVFLAEKLLLAFTIKSGCIPWKEKLALYF